MNEQEVFDTVKTHLLTQNQRAMDRGGSCRYRTPNGLKCAAGVLMPDNAYSPHWEGEGILTIVADHPRALPDSIFNAVNMPLIKDLQILHDEVEPANWAAALTKVAKSYGLTP